MNMEVTTSIGQGFADNPFIQFVHKTREKKVIKRNTLLQCGKILKRLKNNESLRYQWSWERNSLEKAWQHSYGWECVAMINFLMDSTINKYPYEDPGFKGDVRNIFSQEQQR